MSTIELTSLQKELIESRYLYVLENFRRRARKYSALFYLGHFVITVGSLFVPALLSIQNSDKEFLAGNTQITVQMYWATFTISLMVTMFNGILTLFKIDKKYYFLHTTLERLRSEGWQYFGLTGRYAGHLIGPGFPPTHANQFMFFSHYVEKIKMSQVEEEYDKTDDNPAGQQVQQTAATALGGAHVRVPDVHLPSLSKPPPPLVEQLSHENVPRQAKAYVQSMLRSQTHYESSSPPPSPRNPSAFSALSPPPPLSSVLSLSMESNPLAGAEISSP